MKANTSEKIILERDNPEERERFVEEAIRPAGIKDKRILKAFLQVPRHKFVQKRYRKHAYEDSPLPLEKGQTISQPSLVALMTELLHLKGNEKVLEIGTGSGYQAAILSHLAKEIYTVERLPILAKHAERICQDLGYKNVHFHVGDGTLGLAKFQPYDAIIVTAGAKEIPKPLLNQLKVGGSLVIPVGETLQSQRLKVITKSKTGLNIYEVEPVAFVPLIGKHGWENNIKSFINN